MHNQNACPGWTARNKWLFLAIVAGLGFAVDLVTKYLAVSNLKQGIALRLVGDVLSFRLVYNTGGIFGINPRNYIDGFPVNLFFYIFSMFAVIFLIMYYRNIGSADNPVRWGVAIIMPGALGNLFDRIVRPGSGVVDFIELNLHFWPANPWPIFNVADICITAGVIMVVSSVVLHDRHVRE